MRATVASRISSVVLFPTNRPTAALIIAFSLGIGLSRLIHEYSFAALAAAGASLIGASLAALRHDRTLTSLALGLAAVSMGGLSTALAHRDGFPDADLRALIPRGLFKLNEPVSFEGCVAEDGQKQGGQIVSIIELRAFLAKDHWVPCKGKGMIRIAGSEAEGSPAKIPNLLQGDLVRGWATWRLPRNYENPGSAGRRQSLARRGIYVIGRVKSPRLLESVPGACSNAWTRSATSVRNQVRKSLEPIRLKEQGQPAAVLASLLIGDYSQLNNSTREIFQNSGTLHVLVVSALHVAWIAGLFLQFFRSIGVPERTRYLLVALVILFYTWVVGFQASITRCLWMFILYLIGRMLLRRADPANILLASALLLLAAQPDWLFETGFQLSFLSVTAIAMTAVPFIESYLKPLLEPLRNSGKSESLFLQPGPWHQRGRKLRTRCEILIEETADRLSPAVSNLLCRMARALAFTALATGSTIVITLSIQIWIGPLLAHNFNRMSWISPLANLVIVPCSSLVLATGMLTVLADSLHLCGPALMRFSGEFSSLLLRSAGDLAAVAGAWQRCPTPSAAWVLTGIVLLFAWSHFKWRRVWIPLCYTAALLGFVSHGSLPGLGILISKSKSIVCRRDNAIWPKNVSTLSFTFLDVGQGDSTVIAFPNKSVWLVDAGGLLQIPSQEDDAHAFDLGEAVVSRYLWHAWITRLDRLILSHSDLDHAGGARSVLRNFRIGGLVHSHVAPDRVMAGILNTARSENVSVAQVFAGHREEISSVLVRAIHPLPNPTGATANENSLVLQFSYKRFSAILAGDLDRAGEAEILSRSGSPGGLLLKVAHHGSRLGTSNPFLEAVKPRWAVISAGRNNPYGHPSGEVLRRLLRHGARLLLTADQGAITFETDGNAYVIRTHIGGILERGNL